MTKYFEVVLPGFDGSTDETDDLVLWGKANNIEQVKANYPNATVGQFSENEEQHFSSACTDFDFTV